MSALSQEGTVSWLTRRAGRFVCLLAGVLLLTWPVIGKAQNIQSYFPPGVYGYDQELGVTVLTRARPLYETPSIKVGSFDVSSGLSETLFYNSNVNGISGSGSWGSRTSGSISAASDWSRNNAAGTLGFSHNQFFAFPAESYTDWNVGLTGGYTIGSGTLQAGYAHQTFHQIGVNVGSITSQTPVQDQTDTANLSYTFNLARFAITPNFSISAYRFGTATVLGVRLNEELLNRNVLAGGVTTRYSMSDAGSLLLVVRGLTSNFTNQDSQTPNNDSESIQILGGLDYQTKGVWRYRLLLGVEARTFQASQYPTHIGPIIEGSAIWTPTERVTLTGTASRRIEDPETIGTNGYTLTQATLVADYEYLRNVFLQGSGSIQYAQYLQSGGGTQTGFGVGAGVTWLLSRRLRLSLNYNYAEVTGSSSSVDILNRVTNIASVYRQNLIGLTVHIGL